MFGRLFEAVLIEFYPMTLMGMTLWNMGISKVGPGCDRAHEQSEDS